MAPACPGPEGKRRGGRGGGACTRRPGEWWRPGPGCLATGSQTFQASDRAWPYHAARDGTGGTDWPEDLMKRNKLKSYQPVSWNAASSGL